MLPPGLQSPHEVVLYYDSVYYNLIESGDALPFVYPWAGIGAFVVLGYLLIDHRQSQLQRWLRFPVFGFLFAFQTWCVLRTRAKNPAAAFGVGLLSAWGVMWVASIMVINDCQTDFERLEQYPSEGSKGNKVEANGTLDGSIAFTVRDKEHASNVKALSTSNYAKTGMLRWQKYPTGFRDRCDWVADVFCNFRGVGWNWQLSGIPPPPKSVGAQLSGQVDKAQPDEVTVSRTGIRRIADKDALLKAVAIKLVICYLTLDALVTFAHHDPYFWGYMDATPPQFLPSLLQNSGVLIRIYRLAIGLGALYIALNSIFSMGPAFFCGLVGAKRIGLRGEPWMNPPDFFGSYRCVFDQGLAGWWGGWWHQTFRFAFEISSDKLLKALSIEKRSTSGRSISLFVAFFLSGCLHATASYTQLGETRPLMGPMRFFLLQPIGIMLQVYTTQMLRKAGVLDKMPKIVTQAGSFVYVHAWGYYTAPLLIDDFAKGGVFTFEPVAISPLRALGLGAKDDSWFCWRDGIVWWTSGKHWWDTGIAA